MHKKCYLFLFIYVILFTYFGGVNLWKRDIILRNL